PTMTRGIRQVLIKKPGRRVPGFVGIKGLYVQEEWLLVMIFFQPAYGCLGHEFYQRFAVLLPALAIGLVLTQESVQLLKLRQVVVRNDIANVEMSVWGSPVVINFLATNPLVGSITSMKIPARSLQMRDIADEDGNVACSQKHFA